MWRVVLLLLVACGAASKDVEVARASAYDADFQVVYDGVVDVAKTRVRAIEAQPASARVVTAWQEVARASQSDDVEDVSIRNGRPGGYRAKQREATRYYARFDIQIVGPRPWRVEVAEHGAEWRPGAAKPVELPPTTEEPGWLISQRNHLLVDIHDRLRGVAVRSPSSTAPR